MTNTPKTFNAEFQIHHILPTEVFNNESFGEDLIRILDGVNQLQSANNRIAMFTTQASADLFRILQNQTAELRNIETAGTWHKGFGHNGYNRAVEKSLNRIFNGEVMLPPELQRLAVIDLQATLKKCSWTVLLIFMQKMLNSV
ncbi:AHH domain-containing protein [Acinetobacter boissieri]|uniref:A nuclease family of the HNH/ENDO VII superfamily with conserved AHH n=1 Tax=Acinetobacter boissieri TaxID=1219383 RepID=A0A1G6KES2_9GAMM|nr:AHH domain-containing protein [Acinetobacter boissieri]SDC29427.1 A nuclease family of the HNH/ENDO VII superfamily with conserved AHH [Acinetobacter boissieri]